MAAFAAAAIAIQSASQFLPNSNPFGQVSSGPTAATTTSNLQSASIVAYREGPGAGQLTLQMSRPFSDGRASEISSQLGTDVVTAFPAFGTYVLALPRIQVTVVDEKSAEVFFPKLITHDQMLQYLRDNQLSFIRWARNVDGSGRIAEVAIPRIQLQLVDPYLGIFAARIPRHLDSIRVGDWAKSLKMVVVSYDPGTGDARLQMAELVGLNELVGRLRSLSATTSARAAVAPTPTYGPPNSLQTQPTGTGVTLSWLAGVNATAYAIYRSSTVAGTYSYIGQTTTLTYADNAAAAGATSYYRVMSMHACPSSGLAAGGCVSGQPALDARYVTDPVSVAVPAASATTTTTTTQGTATQPASTATSTTSHPQP